MRVLIIALSGIGDALLFTPAAELIKKNVPHVRLDALVMFKGAAEIYDRTGLFNEIIHHDFLSAPKLKSLSVVMKLRGKYDVSINVYPANRIEYNLIQFLAGAPKRGAIQYLRRDFRELGFLNNIRIQENDSVHNVRENISIAKRTLGFETQEEPDLVFPISEEDERFADSYLASCGFGGGDMLIGFHAGSAILKNQAKRRWEPEKFAELGRRLIDSKKARILIFGGPDENDLKARIMAMIDSDRATIPSTSGLAQTAALIRRTSLFVTNDSGMMHVASAMKRKIVAVIGPTNTDYIHPWHTEHEIASLHLECSPCFIYSPRPLKCFRDDVKFKCIKELTVDMVYAKVASLLGHQG